MTASGIKPGVCVAFLPLLLLLNACNIAKHLPANERLYMGSDVVVNADSTVTKVEQTGLKAQLEALARPRPNAQLFGYPFRVGLYYLFGEPRKPKGFRSWFRRKFGSEPVFASARAISANLPVMQATLQNEGYFGSTVAGALAEKSYKARGVFRAAVKARYYVDSVAFLADSTPARKALLAVAGRTIFKKGDPYRFENIKLERERIGQALKQRGLYYFTPDYVGVLADNDSAAHRTTLVFYVKPDMPDAAGVPYFIRNVFIYPNYNLSTARIDTNQRRAYQSAERFNIVDSSRRFNPKLFRDVMTVEPGKRYNSRQQDLTLSRLVNVGAFKFVRNRFEPDEQGDSAVLDVHYYLTPYPAKSVRLELDGTSRSNNFNGTQAILSWRNRNTLRRAELLTLNANVGIEFQVGAGDQAITNYRYGATAVLSFPRLVSPFGFRNDQRQALPKTNATLGYQTIIRGGLYRINSFNTTFGYAWRQSQQIEHVFQPFSANYVFVPGNSIGSRVIEILSDTITSDIVKKQFINTVYKSDQLILSSLYTFNYNSPVRSASPNTFRLTANAEVAGNMASLFFRKPLPDDDQRGIFGVPFAQFLRLDADTRFYRRLTPTLTWANRLFAGLGIPYGNSKTFQLPLPRQYFVGGSNSIRAFRPRAIGPGLYTRDTLRNVPLFQDGGGDIRLEANTELRQKFNKYIEGAVFFDAGNTWTYYTSKALTTDSNDGQFRSDFYKQIAIGTGVGIRIDLSYFLVRLDVATPLRKPYKTNGSEWVIDQINFRSRDWRRQNLVFNIGIGYPF